jgi:hypothetical protein
MSAVNRPTLARASGRLSSASDYTELIRWKYQSSVLPAAGRSAGSYAGLSLAGVSRLITQTISAPPPPVPTCIVATTYSGGTPTSVAAITYDANGVTLPAEYSLLSGGDANTNFC